MNRFRTRVPEELAPFLNKQEYARLRYRVRGRDFVNAFVALPGGVLACFGAYYLIEKICNAWGWGTTISWTLYFLAVCIIFGVSERWMNRRHNRLIWREAQKAGHPICCHCGYNLQGSVSNRCPECGNRIEQAPPK